MKTTIGLIFISLLLNSCGDNSRVFEKAKKAAAKQSVVAPKAVPQENKSMTTSTETEKKEDVVVHENIEDLKISYFTGEMDDLPADLLNCTSKMNMSLYHNLDDNYDVTLQNLMLDTEADFGINAEAYTSTSLRLAPLKIDGKEYKIMNYRLLNDAKKSLTLGNSLDMNSNDLEEIITGKYNVHSYGTLLKTTFKTANGSKQIQLVYSGNRLKFGKITEEVKGLVDNDLCIEGASRYQYTGAKCPLKFGKVFLNDCLPVKPKPSSKADKQ